MDERVAKEKSVYNKSLEKIRQADALFDKCLPLDVARADLAAFDEELHVILAKADVSNKDKEKAIKKARTTHLDSLQAKYGDATLLKAAQDNRGSGKAAAAQSDKAKTNAQQAKSDEAATALAARAAKRAAARGTSGSGMPSSAGAAEAVAGAASSGAGGIAAGVDEGLRARGVEHLASLPAGAVNTLRADLSSMRLDAGVPDSVAAFCAQAGAAGSNINVVSMPGLSVGGLPQLSAAMLGKGSGEHSIVELGHANGHFTTLVLHLPAGAAGALSAIAVDSKGQLETAAAAASRRLCTLNLRNFSMEKVPIDTGVIGGCGLVPMAVVLALRSAGSAAPKASLASSSFPKDVCTGGLQLLAPLFARMDEQQSAAPAGANRGKRAAAECASGAGGSSPPVAAFRELLSTKKSDKREAKFDELVRWAKVVVQPTSGSKPNKKARTE